MMSEAATLLRTGAICVGVEASRLRRNRFQSVALITAIVLIGINCPPRAAAFDDKPSALDLNKLLDELAKLDAKVLQQHLATLQAEHKKLADESAALKKKAQQFDAQAAAVKRRIDVLNILLKPVTPAKKSAQAAPKKPVAKTAAKPAAPPKQPPAKKMAAAPVKKPPAPKPAAAKPQPKPAAKTDAKPKMTPPPGKKPAAAAPKKTPVSKPAAKPAAEKKKMTPPPVKNPDSKKQAPSKPPAMQPAPKTPPAKKPPAKETPPSPANKQMATPAAAKPSFINYADHIRPILLEKCVGCHNPDKSRGGLIVDSFAAIMEGGGSGDVIVPGDPDASRLWLLVSHTEQPNMPLKEPKLDDARLETIRTWIEQGALPDANAKPRAAAAPSNSDIPKQPKAEKPPGDALATETASIPMPAADAPKSLSPRTLRAPTVTALAASPVAPIFAVRGNRQILIHHANEAALLAALPFPEGRVNELQFSADGLWLLAAGGQAGKSGVVVLFDVITGRRLHEVGKQYDAVLAAAIDPYRELVAVGGTNRTVRVHDLLTNQRAWEIKKHNDWITALAFSPDATLLASGDRAGGLFVWEAETGRLVHVLRGHGGAIHDLAFRPDSQSLASAGADRTVRLWDMKSGKQLKRFNAHAVQTLSIDFAPDGRICTGGADGRAKLWKPDGGALRTLEPLGDWVYETCFADAGRLIIAGTWTGELYLFNAADGKLLRKLDSNTPADTDLAMGK